MSRGCLNAANQLTSVSGDVSLTNTYDGNGMWTGDDEGGAASYDERGRTESMTHRGPDGDGAMAMEYDGSSQVDRTRAGGTTFARSLLGVTSSTTAGETTEYVLAPDGRVLGQVEPGGERYYYLTDRLGSVIGVTDSEGERVNDYWYDAFGGYQGGAAADEAAGVPHVPWRYTGEWLDGSHVAGSTYKIGLRYYDALLHRWTQTDPAERITNPGQPAESQPYTYVGCDPVNHTDPSGAYSWSEFGQDALTGVAGLAGGVIGGGVGLLAGPVGGGVGAYVGSTCAAGAFGEALSNPGASGGDVGSACAGNVALGWLR